MLKKILIALMLVITLPLVVEVAFSPAPLFAQAPAESVGSEHFMFDLNAVTHEGIEGSVRQGWIREGINYFFEKAVGFMAAVIGSLAVLTMAIGGFRMITSGGDETAMTKGRQMVVYSLIGLGVTLMAYILVTLVQLLIVSIYG